MYDERSIGSGCNYKVKSAYTSDAAFNRRLNFDKSKLKEGATELNKTYDVKTATMENGTKIFKGSRFSVKEIIFWLSLITSHQFCLA
jgi:hypothetical protein